MALVVVAVAVVLLWLRLWLGGIMKDFHPSPSRIHTLIGVSQWGDLLILSAAFKNANLEDSVDERALKESFQSTN